MAVENAEDFREFIQSSCQEQAENEGKWEKTYARRVLADKMEWDEHRHAMMYWGFANWEQRWFRGKALIVGSGPMPFTRLQLNKYEIEADLLDRDEEACDLARRVLEKLEVSGEVICADAATWDGFGEYDTIFLTIEAGLTGREKWRIMRNVHGQLKPDARVVFRLQYHEDVWRYKFGEDNLPYRLN